MLCLEFVVVLLIPLFAIVHVFADLLLFAPMTTTLM
jgi:hypothetical protein